MDSIATLKLVISDLSMAFLAVEGFPQEGDETRTSYPLLEYLTRNVQAMKSVEQDVTGTVKQALDLLYEMLTHTTEGRMDSHELASLECQSGISKLSGLNKLYAELKEKDEELGKQTRGDVKNLTNDTRVRTCVLI